MSIYTQNLSYGMPGMDGVSKSGAEKYPNPFYDIASAYIPTNLSEIFEYCEYLYLTMQPFKSVSERVVRYFLTKIVVDGPDEKERAKYEDLLEQKLHMIQSLAEIGDDYMTYGNCFISVYFPFDRFLTCPDCHTMYAIETIPYKFNWKDGSFTGTCPKCKKNVTFTRTDKPARHDLDRVRIVRWNPKTMRLKVHPVSGDIDYYCVLDSKFVNKVLEGDPFYLNQTPWGMVEACLHGDKSGNLFKFKKESIFHLKQGTLSGLPIKGWGIPPLLPNFKLAYYIQLLRRYDEAICMDYILPFRILFPQNVAPGGQDALTTISMQSFKAAMQEMVNNKRKNLTSMEVAPFPVGYQLIGGEAKSLSPKDNIQQAMTELLNAEGFPQELYSGSLSLQAAPVALRLFEKQWNALVDGYNSVISWVLNQCTHFFMWGDVTGSLQSVTLADDLERKSFEMQAAAGQDISKQTAYNLLGIDYMNEQKKIIDEQQMIQKLQQEAMEAQQTQQYDQSMSASGQEGPGGTPGATPGDVYEQAGQLANNLLLNTPETMRRGELIKIKHSNPTLHALVLQRMDELRQDWARQGQAQVMQQMKQGEAMEKGASSLPSAVRLKLLLSDQIFDYNRGDLRKIAMDIKNGVPNAEKAFHFIYSAMIGG